MIVPIGVAGFIGSYVAHYLLERGDKVVGIDNLNDYYEVKLKKDRLKDSELKVNYLLVLHMKISHFTI